MDGVHANADGANKEHLLEEEELKVHLEHYMGKAGGPACISEPVQVLIRQVHINNDIKDIVYHPP